MSVCVRAMFTLPFMWLIVMAPWNPFLPSLPKELMTILYEYHEDQHDHGDMRHMYGRRGIVDKIITLPCHLESETQLILPNAKCPKTKKVWL